MTSPKLAIHDRMAELADATRSRILFLLEERELTVSELCSALQLPQSTVSRHLRILADEGWVASRAEGASRWYRMTPELNGDAAALWSVVRSSLAESPAVQQDLARIESIIAQRRSRSAAFIASAADEWDHLRQSLYGMRTDLTATLALLDPNMTVGDLGCGTGALSAAIAPHVEQVYAIDASTEMLVSAQARLSAFDNVTVAHGALESLPLADDTLDAAILMLVLHHVAQPVRVLREVRRVVKNGGRILVADMRAHTREEYRHDMGHVWLGFDDGALRSWMHEAGFRQTRYVPLPVDPSASGPALFTMVGS